MSGSAVRNTLRVLGGQAAAPKELLRKMPEPAGLRAPSYAAMCALQSQEGATHLIVGSEYCAGLAGGKLTLWSAFDKMRVERVAAGLTELEELLKASDSFPVMQTQDVALISALHYALVQAREGEGLSSIMERISSVFDAVCCDTYPLATSARKETALKWVKKFKLRQQAEPSVLPEHVLPHPPRGVRLPRGGLKLHDPRSAPFTADALRHWSASTEDAAAESAFSGGGGGGGGDAPPETPAAGRRRRGGGRAEASTLEEGPPKSIALAEAKAALADALGIGVAARRQRSGFDMTGPLGDPSTGYRCLDCGTEPMNALRLARHVETEEHAEKAAGKTEVQRRFERTLVQTLKMQTAFAWQEQPASS